MAKERFVEVYSQGITNVEKIIADTETGVNYLLASSTFWFIRFCVTHNLSTDCCNRQGIGGRRPPAN